MLEILERISEGRSESGDMEKLKELAPKIQDHSLCGLGQTAPNPVLTTLRYFEDEYEEHIENDSCPASVCRELITFKITDDCIGCTTCREECPVNAIDGESGSRHVIDQEICIKCGTCQEVCPVDAVEVI